MVSEPQSTPPAVDDLDDTQELPMLDLEAYESGIEPNAVSAGDDGEITLIQPVLPPPERRPGPDLAAVEAEVAALGADVERLRGLLIEREAELAAARVQLAGELQRASDAEAARAAAESRLAAALAEIEVGREERTELWRRQEVLEAELRSSQALVDELNAAVAGHTATIAAMSARVEAAERAAAWAEADSRSLRAQLAAVQESLRSREARRGIWEAVWREADAALAAVEQARAAAATASEQSRRADDEAAALRAALSEFEAGAKKREAELLARLDEAKAHAYRLEVELSARSARIEALRALVSVTDAPGETAADASRAEGVGRDPVPGAPRDPQPLPEGPPRFLVLSEGNAETLFRLGRRTTIGRAEDNHITLGRSSISRHHAIIHCGPRQTVIEDLNSTNGVLVNRRRVRQAVLHDGDVVHIGKCRFRFSQRIRGPIEGSTEP